MRLVRLVKLYKHAQKALLESEKKKAQLKVENENREKAKSLIQRRNSQSQMSIMHFQEIKADSRNQMDHNISDLGNNTMIMQPDNFDEEEIPSAQDLPSPGIKSELPLIEETNEEPQVIETNLGRKLSDLTTKRVITIVLAIIISVPMLQLSTFVDINGVELGLLNDVYLWKDNPCSNVFNLTINTLVQKFAETDTSLMWLEFQHSNITNVCPSIVYSDPNKNIDDYRSLEKNVFVLNDELVAIFDGKSALVINSWLSIGRTIFICIVLTAAALMFSNDANTLILTPIENMVEKVKRIGKNPMEAAQIEENEAFAKELLEQEKEKLQLAMLDRQKLSKEEKRRLKKQLKDKKRKENEEVNYETQILERTIIKVGALLALGFGEAGSEIIAKNMEKSGDVDPLIPGKKILAIFGFCDIRNFTDATEVLQENVMVFVNEIADIVHSTVDNFLGSANKNIGDAFLLVWKFPEEDVISDKQTLTLSTREVPKQIADMSVIAFLKIIATIKLSRTIDKYNNHEGLNERLPGYQVKMGFGLHWGWAIEGAIGSVFKIDASYLSPNVNMASRLEAATKQFGVPILISGELYSICSPMLQSHLRMIDRVTVKGSTHPMSLFT